jgi:hypothetical protein
MINQHLSQFKAATACGSVLALLVLAVGVAACDTSAPSFADGPAGAFNPQPDIPYEVLSYSIDIPGEIWWAERMIGTFDDVADGSVNVVTSRADRRGATLHLSQTWTLQKGEVLRVVDVAGVYNFQTGRLVLYGGGAHIRGFYSSTGGTGGFGILVGELMFNPQPDPPLWW